jgi:phosphoribosylamine--glycine ligase
MKVLVIGGGGREHALVWRLARSPQRPQLFCAPGNAGIAKCAQCVEIGPEEIKKLTQFAENEKIDLTLVGPEGPLSLGITDEFTRQGLAIFGPTRAAARLEWDKAFAKSLMARYGIPTADFASFTDADEAKEYIASRPGPWVVKASGLAYGKGTVVARTISQAYQMVEDCLIKQKFGAAGAEIIVEEYLSGEEASIVAITDGEGLQTLLPSQDHKPLYDGDEGPNTGGMGAYAPAPLIDAGLKQAIDDRILRPLLGALKREGIEYRGVIYSGIMMTDKGPFVLEFNSRFGDPETQAVIPLLKTDLLELILAGATGRLPKRELEFEERYALCVVTASQGYPGQYEKGKPIQIGLPEAEDLIYFHAGTQWINGEICTAGGRVLGITGLGRTLKEAYSIAYQAIEKVYFQGIHYRRDIGQKGMRRFYGPDL